MYAPAYPGPMSAMSPYGVDPYGGAMNPYGDVIDPYGGAVDPYGGAVDPYGGVMDPYGGAMDPYGGAMDPYGGAMDPYGGAMDPYGQEMMYGPEMMPAPVEYGPGMGYGMEQEYMMQCPPEVCGQGFEPLMYGTDPVYGMTSPYIDALVDYGYNGPWPADYYRPQPERPYGQQHHHHHHRYRDASSSEESDDEDHCHRRPKQRCHKPCSNQRSTGVTQADIANLLEKFESALSVKHKKARVVESLVKEKRHLKKQVAQAKRDLLLKEALAFNGDAPIPGRRPHAHGHGQQVVSIDYGENSGY